MDRTKRYIKKVYRGVRLALLITEIIVLATVSVWYGVRVNERKAIVAHIHSLDNLISNPSFEGDWTRDTVYWTADGGPYFNHFGEVFTPDGWRSWWVEGTPCPIAYTFTKRRPEIQVIDLDTGFPDVLRFKDGHKAVKAFTFWGCHEMGELQQVTVTPGIYTFSIYAHAWLSDCSSMPHNPPMNKDCDERLWGSWDHLKVGIDPLGGIDPHADGVVWSDNYEQYGVYGDAPFVVENVLVDGDALTVFFSSESNYPLRHNDVYVDMASLVKVMDVESTTYLPLILKGE